MKNLFVYYSHSGNNEKLTYELKDRMEGSIYQICEQKKRKTISILMDFLLNRNTTISDTSIKLKEYDNIIFVAPVWGGKVATPLRAFLEKEKNNLNKYYFISLCNKDTGQEEKIYEELNTITGKNPQKVIQLSINELLPKEQQNKIKYTFNYRVNKSDLQQFNDTLEDFISIVKD